MKSCEQQMAAGNHLIGVFKDGELIAADAEVYAPPNEKEENMIDTPRDKYLRDPVYKALVDMIEHMIHRAEYSPSEIREAAMLACVNYELHTLRSYHIKITPEFDVCLDNLRAWVDGGKTKGLR